MSVPPVPGNVAPYISDAASATGLPESVVAAQNYTESGYGSNEGPSSAGAEGPWQFLPSTFQGLGYSISGIWNWSVSTQAYIKYMNQLLQQEGGNVRNALAAYNAGPGNIQAGYGYADSILAMAGENSSVTTTAATTSSASGGEESSTATSIFPDISNITGFFGDAKTFIDALLWIVNPASWLRIGSFAIGIILLAIAIYAFVRVGDDQPLFKMPQVVPVPV